MSIAFDFSKIAPSKWIDALSTSDHVSSAIRFLKQQGTFEFPKLNSGLFPAASGIGSEFEATGYRSVWVRDNVHIAYAHFQIGEIDVALDCMRALATFLSKQRFRFENVITSGTEHSNPMNRPHIRFNGDDLTELSEKWAHAQNDALGYFLWLYGLLVASQDLAVDEIDWELIANLIHYFEVIEYWQDEDSGHWEETRKISASSIGTVKQSLEQWLDTLLQFVPAGVARLAAAKFPVTIEKIQRLHDLGEAALLEILPAECIQSEPQKYRWYDGALVFLCYPLSTLSRTMHDQVLEEVSTKLLGPNGIRRYEGDSYWCADYKEFLAADQRAVDFSDDLAGRDRLLKPGAEAQWCIFDPAISCAYARRYSNDHQNGFGLDEKTLLKQIGHLQRSLSQLTDASHSLGAYRCPESYFRSRGVWIPNDITPLLWTQANLIQALWWLEKSLQLRERQADK